jgi:hypothetical protein
VGSGHSPRYWPSSGARRARASLTTRAMLRMGWAEFSIDRMTPCRAASRAKSATLRASCGISAGVSQGHSKAVGSTRRRCGDGPPTSFAPCNAAWNGSPDGSVCLVRHGQAMARSKVSAGNACTRLARRASTGRQCSPSPCSYWPRQVCRNSMCRAPRVWASWTRTARSFPSSCCRQELVIAPKIMASHLPMIDVWIQGTIRLSVRHLKYWCIRLP